MSASSDSVTEAGQDPALQPEMDFDWMRKNCGNVDNQNRFLEPAENASELCKREFKAWSEKIRNSEMCRTRRSDISDDMQKIIDRHCNRFVSN